MNNFSLGRVCPKCVILCGLLGDEQLPGIVGNRESLHKCFIMKVEFAAENNTNTH